MTNYIWYQKIPFDSHMFTYHPVCSIRWYVKPSMINEENQNGYYILLCSNFLWRYFSSFSLHSLITKLGGAGSRFGDNLSTDCANFPYSSDLSPKSRRLLITLYTIVVSRNVRERELEPQNQFLWMFITSCIYYLLIPHSTSRWRWWGTAWTTLLPWRRRTSVSPSGPAPTSPLRPQTLSSSGWVKLLSPKCTELQMRLVRGFVNWTYSCVTCRRHSQSVPCLSICHLESITGHFRSSVQALFWCSVLRKERLRGVPCSMAVPK